MHDEQWDVLSVILIEWGLFCVLYTLLEFILLALKMAELFSDSTRFLFSLFWFISCMKFVCVYVCVCVCMYEREKMEWEMCFTYVFDI